MISKSLHSVFNFMESDLSDETRKNKEMDGTDTSPNKDRHNKMT